MCRARAGVAILALTVLGLLIPNGVDASAVYTYDPVGRLTTVVYDNGVCVSYSYDANGNRTALATPATSPQTAVWGSANWGCFNWTP
jgi:YD repeat-containing protein